MQYPSTVDVNGTTVAGKVHNWTYDTLGGIAGLTYEDGGYNPWTTIVSGVQYGPAGELQSLSHLGRTETHTYNSRLQMTRLSVPGAIDISYNYPAGPGNAGRIVSQTDNISGETVTYQYDSLSRLSSANGSGWGQTFGYDGFGNLLSRTGTGSAPPTSSFGVYSATNRSRHTATTPMRICSWLG